LTLKESVFIDVYEMIDQGPSWGAPAKGQELEAIITYLDSNIIRVLDILTTSSEPLGVENLVILKELLLAHPTIPNKGDWKWIEHKVLSTELAALTAGIKDLQKRTTETMRKITKITGEAWQDGFTIQTYCEELKTEIRHAVNEVNTGLEPSGGLQERVNTISAYKTLIEESNIKMAAKIKRHGIRGMGQTRKYASPQ